MDLLSSMYCEISSCVKTIIGFIYPELPICSLCRQPFSQNTTVTICNNCEKQIEFIKDNGCNICGKPLSFGDNKSICINCLKIQRYFSKGKVIGVYEGLLRQCILDFKYMGQWQLAKPLGTLMGEFVKLWGDMNRDIILIPVPLHEERYNERGYNQSQLLAEYVRDVTGLSISTDNLLRINPTEPQKGLTTVEREENLENAFNLVCPDEVRERTILVIDDIMTTGVTVNQCSKVLVRAGAKDVKVLALAAGRILS